MKFRCPTLSESIAATLALLPRGRAWQTHEGGPWREIVSGFQPGAFQGDTFSTDGRKGSVIYAFFAAIGEVRNYLEQRICALRLEFWCATHSETHDQWMTEYGLPDACDPFPDLCTKVAALGGSRCEYFSAIVARLGWTISCIDGTQSCGSRIGCFRSGKGKTGHQFGNILRIVVHLNESPAFGGRIQTPSRAGRWRMGRPMPCPPNIRPLQCLIERITPAHLQIQYELLEEA